MTAYELSLLNQAGELIEDTAELGCRVARLLLGSARTAGLDPAVHAPLTGAALVLGASQVTVYTADGRAHPDDICFLADAADAEDDARELLDAARALAGKATAARAAAHADLEAAFADMDAAEDDADGDDAAARAQEARDRINLCERTLGLLAELARRLRHAIARLQAVPVVLGETYEAVYDLIRAGGRMPYEGRWITGEDPAPAARRRGPALAVLPGALAGRLLSAGWRELHGQPGAFRVFEAPDGTTTVTVPLQAGLADFAMWIVQALNQFAAWQRSRRTAARGAR